MDEDLQKNGHDAAAGVAVDEGAPEQDSEITTEGTVAVEEGAPETPEEQLPAAAIEEGVAQSTASEEVPEAVEEGAPEPVLGEPADQDLQDATTAAEENQLPAAGIENDAQPDAEAEEIVAEQFVIEAPAGPDEDEHLKAIIEAAIYITDEPLTPAQIATALVLPAEHVNRLLDELAAEYSRPGRGLTIREIAGGYKMATKPEHHEAIRTFVKNLKPPLKLSLAALETLAVIAYKQPVTAPEIMEIRGVQGLGVLKTLLDRKLIAAGGRKQVVGKPILYKTTKEFLVQFGLKDLSELPTLKEFEELGKLALSDLDEPQAPDPKASEPDPSSAPEPVKEPEPEPEPVKDPDPAEDEPGPPTDPEHAPVKAEAEETAAPEVATVEKADEQEPGT